MTPVTTDGSDQVRISAGASVDTYLCGTAADGEVSSDPARLALRFPLPLHLAAAEFIYLDLQRVRLAGRLDQDGSGVMHLGGGVAVEQIHQVYLPAFVDFLNQRLLTHPDGGTAHLAAAVDGKCVDTIDGCEDVVNLEGECEQSDPPLITVTEIRCNLVLGGAFRPDLDVNGDQVPDLLSVGIKLELVPVTIAE